MKKRIFAFVFAATILMAYVFIAVVADVETSPPEQVVLSELSMDEQLEFLRSRGVEVPDVYTRLVEIFLPLFEEDPNYPAAISNPVAYELAEQIRVAVNDYYQ